jgi:hypothetical protein
MDLSEMSPMDRNRAVEGDLWTLQDILAEAYTRVGGTPDPVAHRRELTRLEALCAILRETSQMSGSKSSKRVLCSLVIALRQMQTATRMGMVGMDIQLDQDEVVWLPHSDMTEGFSSDTHWIGTIEGWLRLAAFIRARRKGPLQDPKLATLFSWTSAHEADTFEEVSLKPISRELIDDSSWSRPGGQRPGTVANLSNFARLLRDVDAAVRRRTAADFFEWADEVRNGANLVGWISQHAVPGTVTAETAVEAATIALEVLTTRFEEGAVGMVFRRQGNDVRFLGAEPVSGVAAVPAGAVWIGDFDAWYRLAEFVLRRLRLGNDGGIIRKALLSDDGRKLPKKEPSLSEVLPVKPPQKRAKAKSSPPV